MTAEDFKEWRLEMGFTQQEAGDALGLSKWTIVDYEAGKRRSNGAPVKIPQRVVVACAALTGDRS